MRKLTVQLDRPYDILIQNGILSTCGDVIRPLTTAKKAAVITDSNVGPLYYETVKQSLTANGFSVCCYTFPAGESAKHIGTISSIQEFLATEGLTRSDLIVALGGGVCGDMAGFAAAIYLRGISFVQIPTTLLAQIDSSVGGKTGVDLPQGKNLCGAFWQPLGVLIDPQVLKTLPEAYFIDGLGEAVKYGCIKDEALFRRLETEDPNDFLEDLIYESVDIKRGVVERDEKESGERMLLNFGHTLGHALEKAYNFETLSHGLAVGIGMVLVTQMSEAAGLTEPGTADRIISVLKRFGMPVSDKTSMPVLLDAAMADKKRTGDGIRFVLLEKIGVSYVKTIKQEEFERYFKETL